MGDQALAGLRVIDLSMIWAGPYCTGILANMGAEVIKVEACQRQDAVRYIIFPENEPGERPWNRGGQFHQFNRNKMGLTLDLSSSEGVRLLKELIKVSDVLVENYTPRVMKSFGLDYPALKQVKPDLIMLSISGHGQTGPNRDYLALGTGTQATAGLAQMTGYSNGPPMRLAISYGDPVAGLAGAGAILSALIYREQTGIGQYIDLSMKETLNHLMGEAFLEYSMNGTSPVRQGNRHAYMAPHGCYRCRDRDEWLTIAVATDEEWRALCNVLGSPGWTREPEFADSLSRWRNQNTLDKHVEEWTSRQDARQASHLLQEAGIAAGPVLNVKELLADPHLAARGFFEAITHPESGSRVLSGMPWNLSKTPGHFRMPAPCLGEHNEYVLGELLGLAEGQMLDLARHQVIGSEPVDTSIPPPAVPIAELEKAGALLVDKSYRG